jgi:hypothetical protein
VTSYSSLWVVSQLQVAAVMGFAAVLLCSLQICHCSKAALAYPQHPCVTRACAPDGVWLDMVLSARSRCVNIMLTVYLHRMRMQKSPA